MEHDSVLCVRNLRKEFTTKNRANAVAVDDVSFCVQAGECVALVGGSGCGKSTTARMIARLMDCTSGEIWLNGQDVTHVRGPAQRALYAHLQMVFQNPVGSFDPRRTLGHGIAEPLRNAGISKAEARNKALLALEQCGVDASFASRYPNEVSGGQCQRAAIARALVIEPELVICDEATSALDVTVQAQIVQMLSSIQRSRGLALLFICHDLALVQGFCDRTLVMHAGRIVEEGPTTRVLSHPQHEYTKKLVDATR